MTDCKRKKKRGRNKLFRSCFRSFAADEGRSLSDGRDNKFGRLGKPVLIAVSGRNGRDFIPDVNLVNGGVADNGGDCYAKRSSPRRRFSRLLKAVLFDSVMVKRIHRSSSKSSIASDTSASFSNEKMGKSSDDCNACGKEFTDDDSSSRRSNLLSSSSRNTSSSYSTSSSSSSSTNSNSRWSSDQKASSQIDSVDFRHPVSSNSLKKPNPINSSSLSSRTDSTTLRRQDSSISLPSTKPKSINSNSQSLSYKKGSSRKNSLDSKLLVSSMLLPSTKDNHDEIESGGNTWNLRWCLFIILSLVVLVIWGRIFSILCTSTWFYSVPCKRIKRVNSVTNAVSLIDTDSEQYKKRVIMAGLLDRTRNPST